jgi:hypothetical protein
MIELISAEQMQPAIARARESRLYVRPTSLYRQYLVENRDNGAVYYVNFFVEGRRKYAGCQCKAGRNNMLCKHIAAAAGYHLMLAAGRKPRQQNAA